MNTGTESDGGKKALKTHRASTLTAHLIQRGLIVIRPGDTAPNRHVELFKLLHFITIVSFLQDKAGIKNPILPSVFNFSFLFKSAYDL